MFIYIYIYIYIQTCSASNPEELEKLDRLEYPKSWIGFLTEQQTRSRRSHRWTHAWTFRLLAERSNRLSYESKRDAPAILLLASALPGEQ